MASPASRDLPSPGVRRTAAEIQGVLRGATHTHRLLRSRLTILAVATLLLDAVGTLLMYVLEHDRSASGFHDLGGALFWVTAQLTTVSSQLPNPVTAPGRVVDVVLELWAITAVATLAGALGSFFTARHRETASGRDPATERR